VKLGSGSRNHLPLEQKFPTITTAAEELNPRSTILDGEIVALDNQGIPRFQLLQQWQKRPTAPVCFYLLDLLWSDGRDLTGKTVLQRRERLEEIITPVAGIQVGGYIEEHGTDLFQLAKEKGLVRGHPREAQAQYLPTRKAIPGLAEDQVTAATRICCIAASRKVKAVANILGPCYWARIETGSSTTSGIRGPDSLRKDWQKRSID
jgi:hypothetical protein